MDDDPGFSDDGRDLCRYRCESRAYQALQASGLCDQGIVPRFYGVFENIDPSMPMLGSSLEALFKEDKKRPCAILLEYLPGSKCFSSETFSPELFEGAIAGLEKIHAAGVIHNDSHPKNVLVVEGEGGILNLDDGLFGLTLMCQLCSLRTVQAGSLIWIWMEKLSGR